MKTIKLIGDQFGNSIGFGGENLDEQPRLMRWDRSPPTSDDVVVFTDTHLEDHKDYPARRRMALLVESPAIRPGIYEWIVEHFHEFDTILTHQRGLVELGYPFLFYALGGSWIKKWDLFPKTQMISLLLSPKTGTRGHRLRHEASRLSNVDSYGSGVGAHCLPWVALRDYRFAIVIENVMSDAYFSEKLIDVISQGTVPIYRGCPDIGRFFNPQGMILWRDLEELEAITKSLRPEDYARYAPYLRENIERARDFWCPEDWIMTVYPKVFDG